MKSFFSFGLILSLILSPCSSWAADRSGTAADANSKEENLETQLSYPELEVTPRASERLDIEYKNEKRTSWQTHLPIQFSALATLYAGTSSSVKDGATADEKDSYETAQTIAVGVGAGWLVLTGALAAAYRPYRTGRIEISKLPKGTPREQLTRERISEEALYAPAALANK
ncbi:MAG: hypothetical protein KDD38_02450, partial [Bdellovibrionales bacterium]|nr:hypothetical protein [Bdellovibrionales bacterium]